MEIRLNKFISSNSTFSRRKADELIAEGKVFVNNKRIIELGTKIDSEKDKVMINNQIINVENEKIYLALNKPKGYITTRDDELGRETVMSLLPKIENLKPVGRLDIDTEGLLLFSNDGEFINKHTHPKFECEKTYYVIIFGELNNNEKQQLEDGIFIEGKLTSKSKIKILKKDNIATVLTIEIHEGRNRQIRKMFGYFDHNVKYLKRIKIGKILLGSLEKGKFRKLTKKEVLKNY